MLITSRPNHTVFISLHSQLRRHRRTVMTAVAVLAVAAMVLTAHSAVMPAGGDHMGGAATICLTIGVCVAAITVAALTVRRLLQRPTWLVLTPSAPLLRFNPSPIGFPARAGPSRALSQVFRL
jgi:hypothetical protein